MTGPRNDWRLTTALFALTGLVESLAFGHLGAFTPLFLQQLDVPRDAVRYWTGILSAMGFVIGLPLLPFWAVWADRYGRKLIIIRSSIAGAAMFALAGASSSVWMLAGARFLGGFVLGNTGVMLAVQADITPRPRLGTAVSIMSSGAPVGMAIGPYLGGLVVQATGIRSLLFLDAGLTAVIAVALSLLLREEPHERTAPAGTRAGVVDALRSVVHTPLVAALFVAVFLIMSGVSMAQPYVPLLVERLYSGPVVRVAAVIGAVLTASGVAMAVATPFWGSIGDRLGHLGVLRACAIATAACLLGQALAPGLAPVAAWRAAQGLFQGGLGALAMVLLALYTPAERRSSVLTLSLLPQQMAWFLGPLGGSALSMAGLRAPFWGAAIAVVAGWAASLRLPPPKEALGAAANTAG